MQDTGSVHASIFLIPLLCSLIDKLAQVGFRRRNVGILAFLFLIVSDVSDVRFGSDACVGVDGVCDFFGIIGYSL